MKRLRDTFIAFALLVLSCGMCFAARAQDTDQKKTVYEGFGVFCTQGTAREGRMIADEAARVLPILKEKFGPEPQTHIRIVLAETIEEFHSAVGRSMPSWVVGVALGGRNTIVLKSQRLAKRGGTNIKKTVRHELTHVVLDANYSMDRLPRWFNEGVAMWQADEPTFRGDFNLAAAVFFGRFVPLQRLDGAFRTAQNDVASVCYGESRSLVNFIIDQHGEEALIELLEHTKTNSTEDPFQAVLHQPVDRLYLQWRSSFRKYLFMYSIMSGIGLFWLMGLLVLIGYIRTKLRNRKTIKRWDEEEADPDFYI